MSKVDSGQPLINIIHIRFTHSIYYQKYNSDNPYCKVCNHKTQKQQFSPWIIYVQKKNMGYMYNHSSCSIRLMSILFRSSLIKLALTQPLQFADNTFRYAINGNGIDANNQLLFFIDIRLTQLCIRQRATLQWFKNIDLLIHHFHTTTIG